MKQKNAFVYTIVNNTPIIVINNIAKNYTIPKLFIPKVDGKPSVAKGKYWYVWYYFRNPSTGKFDRGKPIIIKKGINRLKSVSERKKYGKDLVAALTQILKDGYSPFVNPNIVAKPTENIKISDALYLALNSKRNNVSEATFLDYESRLRLFIEWVDKNKFDHLYITELEKYQVVSFLNDVTKNTSARNSNNFRSVLSSLFGELVKSQYIKYNFVTDIGKMATNPKRNRPYTELELMKLKQFLIAEDYRLYVYMSVCAYLFLRPKEVASLKVGQVYLKEKKIYRDTKSNKNEVIPIIKSVYHLLSDMQLHKYPEDYYVFAPGLQPNEWNIKNDINRRDYWGKRFLKLKQRNNFNMDNSIYSIRHSFAVNIYNNMLQMGYNEREAILKMLPITRHKNEKSLRNYLRSVNAFVADDFSDLITTDF